MFTTILQLSLIVTLYLGYLSGAGWGWWAASLFFSTVVYTLIGNNIAMHRYFTHAHFTVCKPIEWLFLWIASMLGFGGPLSYAMIHIVHHKHPDSEFDPHGPARGKRAWLVYFQRKIDITETPIFSRRLQELNKKYRWIHDYYVLFVLVNATILYFISPMVLLFLWAIPASAACWFVTISIWRQHIGLKANNSRFANWDVIYEGLHEHHHNYPMAPNTALLPGEIDWTFRVAKLFGAKFNTKGQPSIDNVEK